VLESNSIVLKFIK